MFCLRHSWSSSSAVGLEVDEGTAGLGQLCNGDSSSLLDVLRHSSHLLRSDVDELSSVINHTYGGKERTLKSALWLLSLPDRHQSLLEGTFQLLRLHFISRAGRMTCWQPGFYLLSTVGSLSRAVTAAECLGKTNLFKGTHSFH